MAVVLLAAFLMIACLLALRFEKQLTAVLPLATCILILILYVLAFFRRLSWIDYFSTAIVVGAVLRVLFLSGEKKKFRPKKRRYTVFGGIMRTSGSA